MYTTIHLSFFLVKLTLIVVPFESTKNKVGLNRDATSRHATLNHGCLILGKGWVPGTKQEVIKIGVQMS